MKWTFVFAMALAQLQAAGPATFQGVITDSMCGRDHKPMNMGTDEECTRACIRSSPSTVKYVLWDGKTAYKLSDQKTPEKFAGKKVVVKGTLFEKTGVLQVAAITAQ